MSNGSQPTPGPARQSTPPPPLERARVGRYEVIYPLSEGGMASVHVGRLSGMAGFEKLVAIKVIHPHLAVQREFVSMFLDEARLAARIHHPNVGEIIEIDNDDGLLFMIGELIYGRDMRQLFRRASAAGMLIPPAVCAEICSKVCLGLHSAHELRGDDGELLSLVHRDISPRNILISYDGFVKLIDFGVARSRDRLADTEGDSLKGKIAYMAPEQIRGQDVDRRSDLFSLGVVLYQMVTGKHPFPGHDDAERMELITAGKYVPPAQRNPNLPPELAQIIDKALAGDRMQRFPTATAMGEALERFVAKSGVSVGPATLSAMMNRLFKDKIADHEIKLRVYRREHGDSTGIQDIPYSDAVGDIEADTSPGTPRAKSATATRRRRPSLIVGAFAAAIVIIIGLLAALLRSGEKDAPTTPVTSTPAAVAPSPAPRTSLPDPAPAVPEKPPATTEIPAVSESTISLRVDPPGATLELDGNQLEPGTTEIALATDSGDHEISASLDGWQSTTRRFNAEEDQEISIRLEQLPHTKKTDKTKRDRRKKRKTKDGLLKSPYQ